MGNKGQHTQESKVENEFVAQYVLKKGERISAALTMLGRLIGQYDPYGSAFVKMSHNVLEGCVLFSSALISGEGLAAARHSAAQALQQTRSLLSSAFYAGIINEHNFLTLSEEVGALNVRINNITESRLYALADRESFVVASALAPSATPPAAAAGTPAAAAASSKAPARRLKAEAAPTPTNAPRANLTTTRDESRSRRDAILTIIGHKGRVSIRDITDEIRGVSAKTIQRELNALIRDGLVLREGERRWSTYRLAG
ncbi:MAG: hypothetical protein KatS3mg100_067 [Candidatus Parcubacteria bacterium]|nr:MAG: hypothetical protein KatS3mg100_067 [Candidatus Parcubacteria bacterium]